MPLPPFLFTTEVTPETAKQDHLQITFDSWVLSGSTGDIDELRHRLGSPPESVRTGNAEDVMCVWGHLFNRPQQRGAMRRPMSIRGESLYIGDTIIPPPLFSGSWKFSKYAHDDLIERPVRTRLQLHLNPTRYVRHQIPRPLPSTAHGSHWPEAVLYAHKGTSEIFGEAASDNNDNWIPQLGRWEAFANPARWERHFNKYIEAVTNELENELARINAFSHAVDWERQIQMFNLHSSETYWEFFSENPTALVASLEPLLKSFAARSCQAVAYTGTTASQVVYNSLCITAEVGSGRKIKIYAKTNRRVRIEVFHAFRGSNGFTMEGGHTGYWHELWPKMKKLAEDATELVNRMFAYFRAKNDVTPSHICAYQLLMEIVRHARDFPTAITIASALLHLDRVAAEGVGNKMQRALQRLSVAGVLEYNAHAKNYVVTAPRRHALRMLKKNGDFSLLVARVRRRNPNGNI